MVTASGSPSGIATTTTVTDIMNAFTKPSTIDVLPGRAHILMTFAENVMKENSIPM